MRKLLVFLFLLSTQLAFAGGVEFQVNTLRTTDGETFTTDDILDVKVGISESGKVEVTAVLLKNGRQVKRSEISSIIMAGNTPAEEISHTGARMRYPTTVAEVARASGNGTFGGACP